MIHSRGKQPWYKKEISFGRVPQLDLVMFVKQFAIMLEAGLTVIEALQISIEQSTGTLKKVLRKVHARVNAGSMFGDALALEPKVFNQVLVQSAVVGESSGSLAKNFRRAAVQMERSYALKQSVQAAMLYPMIVLVLAMGLGLGIAFFILPQVTGLLTSLDVELPFTTRVLLWISGVFELYGGWILASGIFFIGAGVLLVRQPFMVPRVDRFVLKLPLFGGLVANVNRAHICRTIGTLLESGVPIQEALRIAAASLPNTVFRTSAMRLAQNISSGESFSDLVKLEPKLYPLLLTRMIEIGEQTGQLGQMLEDLASYYEERSEHLSKNMATLVEPVLLLLIGLTVGTLALSVLTPIYSVTSNIRV